MPYLIIDPVGQYPRHLVSFLGGSGKAGIAVFTTRMRQMIWENKWSRELGQYVIESHLLPEWPSVAVRRDSFSFGRLTYHWEVMTESLRVTNPRGFMTAAA